MGWLNFGGKKRKDAQGFGNSKQGKSRPRRKTFILEKIVTPSAGVGGWLQDFDPLHQLLGSWSLSDLHLPNFLADSGVCPIDPSGDPTNNLPPLIDFDPLGLYHDGIATQTPYNPGGAFETLPVAVIPVDPHSPNPNNPNAIRQLLDFPLASQPLLGSIDTGVSADSPYLNYANIKKGRDYVGGDDNPLLEPGEGSEHGTFMLGIIDAINKTAPKWVGRAIDSGRWADSLVEFVDAAKASGQKNAIANLSLDLTQKNPDGSVTTRYELTPQERSAIEYARQNGVMLVVAAGNDGGVMSVLGQASQEFDNIFTVGAGDINGRSNYSSYGRGLDIVADGGTSEHPALSTAGNDLGTMAGTSVATAKVTGAISLVWAANPGLSYRQVIEILKSTARDLGTPGWDDETGFGFLNTLAAVDLAKKTTPEVYKPTAFFQPTTWGGDGIVTPSERAVNIVNESFTAWVVSSNGITLRNSPNTSDRSNLVVKYGDTLTFDGWTYGETLNDLTTGEADALWYRFRYNGGTYWVPSAWTGGYPGSRPPLLPPAQQQQQQPPQQQQPTANTVYLSTSSGQILQVNTATGAQNPIYQGRAFTDLAVAPNGKLYGCTFYDGLYEINPSTGAERYVGPLAGGSINSLTFSPDGRLYGADEINGNLFQISPDNGQMNLIGNLGAPSSGDLVFNGANEIFATVGSPNTSLNDRLVAFNVATGTVRNIGDLGLRQVYGLSLENGQLTAYTSDRRKLAIDQNTAKATVVGTVSSNGLIWGAGTKPATASSPTDDVRQKFLYAASQYPQVGAAITGVQDQGGGVFRQEFERAIMIWNGQQVTVYETKGRSASPTSPSPNPQPVNNGNIGNNSGNGGGSGNSNPISGKGVTIRTGASGGSIGNSNSSGSSHASSSSSSSNSPSGNTSSNSSSSSANASSASNISESTGNNSDNNVEGPIGGEGVFSHAVERPFKMYIPGYIVEGTTELKVAGKLVVDSSTVSFSNEEVKLKQKIDSTELNLKMDFKEKLFSVSIGNETLEVGITGFSANYFTGWISGEVEEKIPLGTFTGLNAELEGSRTVKVNARYHLDLGTKSAYEKVVEFIKIVANSGENRGIAWDVFLAAYPDVDLWMRTVGFNTAIGMIATGLALAGVSIGSLIWSGGLSVPSWLALPAALAGTTAGVVLLVGLQKVYF